MTGSKTHSPATTTYGALRVILPDLAFLRIAIVNAYLVGHPDAGDRGWVLVDTGLRGFSERIVRAAAARFGAGARPAAIILTHGHLDHAGGALELAERWDVPIYAHRLELPYLTGRSAYPPPDPTVGGGAMSALSRFFPTAPLDLGARIRELPADNGVPGLEGWRWIHTPGHSPGHISMFREADRTLIAGDAVVTTDQESVLAILHQRIELQGPPAFFTPDWIEARRSSGTLSALEPEILASGHGVPLSGPGMREALRLLARRFDSLARPGKGRYVARPAVMDERGVVSLPPKVDDPLPRIILGVGLVAIAGALILRRRRKVT
ncbi:MAG: MBL fold metallo-hydrolase [Gemmatimonadota bacterium]